MDAELKHPWCSLVTFQTHFIFWPLETDKQPYKKHMGVWGGEDLEFKTNFLSRPQIFISSATKHLIAQKYHFPQDNQLFWYPGERLAPHSIFLSDWQHILYMALSAFSSPFCWGRAGYGHMHHLGHIWHLCPRHTRRMSSCLHLFTEDQELEFSSQVYS